MRKTLLVVFPLLFSGMIVAQEPIPINNTDSLWLTEHLEPLPDSVFPYRQMEQEAPPEYSCSTCIETGNDLPTGDQLSCEDFEAYSTGLLLPDAHPWRKWYKASPRAVIANLQGTKTARFTGGADMLYLLGDKTTGRYRVSWRMYVPTGKKGYFSFQHTLPNINSNTSFGANWAYHVYFDGASKGRLVIVNGTNTATTIEFGYPEDSWFNVVNILSPDPDPDLRSANLFINNSFVYFWYFNQGTNPSNQLSAINFYADADNDFYVDNICYWGKKTGCATSNPTTVCIKNGQQENVDAARCLLYTSREWWECSIACDLGGPYVYRGDNYTGTLNLSDFIFTQEPTTCAIFSTVPQVMDVYLFYKDDDRPFTFEFKNTDLAKVYSYIFACKIPNGIGSCIRGRGNCLSPNGTEGTSPCNNLYYICIIGPAGSTYSFNIIPSGPCAANPDKINFNPTTGAATVSGAVAASGSNFSKAGNAYKSCYSGNRSYASGEKIYQFTLNRPSEVSVTLSSSSRMGVFLYSFLCGRDCIGFAENTSTQNGVLTARLKYQNIVKQFLGHQSNFLFSPNLFW